MSILFLKPPSNSHLLTTVLTAWKTSPVEPLDYYKLFNNGPDVKQARDTTRTLLVWPVRENTACYPWSRSQGLVKPIMISNCSFTRAKTNNF